MFDFWKEVVINSATIDGRPRVSFENDVLRVLRCADYAKAGIVDGKIYKTTPQEGTKGTITVNAPAPAEGNVLRLVLDLRLVGKTDSDFAQPWSVFKKPVIIESASVEGILKNLKAIVPADYQYLTVTGNEIVLGNEYMVAYSAKIEEIDAKGEVVKTTELAVTAGKPAVGSGQWILENLRFPTNANLRYASPNADEMPIADAKYVQYAFEYAVPNRGLHGQGTVGQAMTSVTHHVFFVREDLSAIHSAFTTAGAVEVSGDVLKAGYGDPKAKVPAIIINEDEQGES